VKSRIANSIEVFLICIGISCANVNELQLFVGPNKWKSHSEEWLFPGLKIIANFFSERINCKQFIR